MRHQQNAVRAKPFGFLRISNRNSRRAARTGEKYRQAYYAITGREL